MANKDVKTIDTRMPTGLSAFLIRATILFLGWTLLYYLWLRPIGIPDNQLTRFIILATQKGLQLFYSTVTVNGQEILISGGHAVNITYACNGFELYALYVGFLIAMPTNMKRLIKYTLLGIVVITGTNIIRCILLSIMFYNHYALADFAHHFLFKLIIYGIIFLIWMQYSKATKTNA
ncbi:MAG: hypothetical protein H0X33_10690 [Taibaiella sp.]|nr:hypothetical protein [Taibaiella sp.]